MQLSSRRPQAAREKDRIRREEEEKKRAQAAEQAAQAVGFRARPALHRDEVELVGRLEPADGLGERAGRSRVAAHARLVVERVKRHGRSRPGRVPARDDADVGRSRAEMLDERGFARALRAHHDHDVRHAREGRRRAARNVCAGFWCSANLNLPQ